MSVRGGRFDVLEKRGVQIAFGMARSADIARRFNGFQPYKGSSPLAERDWRAAYWKIISFLHLTDPKEESPPLDEIVHTTQHHCPRKFPPREASTQIFGRSDFAAFLSPPTRIYINSLGRL